ncbi:hypothetical protein ACFSQT_28230 [Mesorhizobium calcicola]|uniref:Uncharacterized protein n=1 Tax=Mesorhizobium calcicola TaxID=1300310 RepID=A0ABW4WJT4_9HYPH
MLKKIAFATILIQVAAFAGLVTETVLFTSTTTTQAAGAHPDGTVANH